MSDTDGHQEYVCGAPLVTDPVRKQLNQRQLTDYREERRDLLTWLRDLGKNPDRGKGYATDTVYNRAYRIDGFYRWVWDNDGGIRHKLPRTTGTHTVVNCSPVIVQTATERGNKRP